MISKVKYSILTFLCLIGIHCFGQWYDYKSRAVGLGYGQTHINAIRGCAHCAKIEFLYK